MSNHRATFAVQEEAEEGEEVHYSFIHSGRTFYKHHAVKLKVSATTNVHLSSDAYIGHSIGLTLQPFFALFSPQRLS